MTTISNLCRALFLGTILFSMSSTQSADVIAVSQSNGGRINVLGPQGTPGTQLASLDTDTGEFSNLKTLTSRQSGSFSAMSRDGEGTLYAIQHYPVLKLVTLDETTGFATDIAAITDSAGPMYQIRGIPEMAFVGTTLYAIIKRDYVDVFDFLPEDDTLASVDTGFILVTIDLATGATSETGIYLGGQYSGRAHGLAYDATIGLIHFYVDEAEGDEPSGGSSVEIIDIQGSTTHDVDFYQQNSGSSQPNGFQGVASVGAGEFLVYNNNGDNFYLLTISEMGPPDPVGPIYTWDAEYLSLSLDIYGIKALETAGDSFVVEHFGFLEYYDQTGAETADPVLTSVGGFPAQINSIATNPNSEQIVALGYDGKGKGMPRNAVSKEILVEKRSGQGLFHINPNGPEEMEFSDLAVKFYNSGDLELAGNIGAITFDERGMLYGFAENVYTNDLEKSSSSLNYLVKIDTQTGEVTPVTEIGMDMGYSYQLEYNPEDGHFYVLYYFNYDGPPEVVLERVSKDGTVTNVELSGEYPSDMRPNSLVFVGLNTFIFTMENNYMGGDLIFELTSGGEITPTNSLEKEPELGFELYSGPYTTYGLARAGSFARGDVAIGEKASRLRGKNRYSSNGAGQSIRVKKTVRRLKTDYFASLENDGAYAGIMKIRGSKGNRRTKITYKAGGRNVTGSVVRGTPLELGPGAGTKVKVSVNQRGGKRLNANNRLAICYGSAADLAKAKLRLAIKTRGGSIKPTSLF